MMIGGQNLSAGDFKKIFDRMTEIDTNPQSKEAKEYYRQLAELEKKAPTKRPMSMIVKTMRRGKTMYEEDILLGADGNPLPKEEALFQKKYTDFATETFPEINPVDVIQPDYKGQGTVKL